MWYHKGMSDALMAQEQHPTTGDGWILECEVPSESHSGVKYAVMSDPASGQWKYTCPDYVM